MNYSFRYVASLKVWHTHIFDQLDLFQMSASVEVDGIRGSKHPEIFVEAFSETNLSRKASSHISGCAAVEFVMCIFSTLITQHIFEKKE